MRVQARAVGMICMKKLDFKQIFFLTNEQMGADKEVIFEFYESVLFIAVICKWTLAENKNWNIV